MRRQNSCGFGLVLVVIWLNCPMSGWSADDPMSTPPREISPFDQALSDTTNSPLGIEPVSYSTQHNRHDGVVDNCEDAAPGVGKCLLHVPVMVMQMPGKVWQTTQDAHRRCQRKQQCVKWWFGYIRGNGPAVWERED